MTDYEEMSDEEYEEALTDEQEGQRQSAQEGTDALDPADGVRSARAKAREAQATEPVEVPEEEAA